MRCWYKSLLVLNFFFFPLNLHPNIHQWDNKCSHLRFQSISMFGYSLNLDKHMCSIFLLQKTLEKVTSSFSFHVIITQKTILKMSSDLCKICRKGMEKSVLPWVYFFSICFVVVVLLRFFLLFLMYYPLDTPIVVGNVLESWIFRKSS